MTKTYIYALRGKGSTEVRYVGQTRAPEFRLKAHVADTPIDGDANPKRRWIEEVLWSGDEIVMDILDGCHCDNAVEKEQYWIDYYLSAGHGLTNTSKAIKAKVTPAERLTIEVVSVRLNEKERKMLDVVHAKYPAMSRGGCLIQVLYDVMKGEVQP